MHITATMNVLDGWLSGLVHRSAWDHPLERRRHERFILARTATTLAALAALPAYLVTRAGPTLLECLALLALAAPLAAVFLLSRFGRIAIAQALVSAALTLFIAGAALSSGGLASGIGFALLAVPLDGMLAANRRGAMLALILGAAGLPALVLFGDGASAAGSQAALAALFAVALSFGLGHAFALMVSERRVESALADALRASRAREPDALQSIDDLVTWHDAGGLVLRANGAGARLLGVAPADLKGHGLFSRILVSDRPAFLKALSEAARSRAPAVAQFRLQAENPGAPARGPMLRWVEMRVQPFEGEEGCAVVAVTRDISAHHQALDESEARLKAAESVSERRARLLATVSHELRTPLNAIIGYAEILMGLPEGRDGATRESYARIVHQSGQHMLGVVNTLLDLSTIEAGAYGLSPEPLDIPALIGDCRRFMAVEAERAGVVLSEDVAPEWPAFFADRRAMQQILLNLLSNAVKFTPSGGLVTIEARWERDGLALCVRDTGIGMSDNEIHRLGDPFYRASGRGGSPGAGLGLSIVRALVGLHGGRMAIRSALGEGTQVSLHLPSGGRGQGGGIAVPDDSEIGQVEVLQRA